MLELMRGRSIGYAVPGTGTEDYVSVYNKFFPPATYNSYISAISGAQAGAAAPANQRAAAVGSTATSECVC